MIQRATVGWEPLSDNAVIAVRSLDVLTPRSPLVGQWSSGPSQVLGEDVYTPGPLLYWLLALPARLPDAVWLELTMGLVNVASVLGVIGLARRRGGWPLAFAVAVAIPVMLASLPADTLSDIWNATVPLLPVTLLIFLTWSLVCGEYRLLPLTCLVASFTAQGHLSYVPPTFGALAVGFGGLAASRRRIPRRWTVAAIAVGAVCWIPPLLEQAIHRPGNLVRLWRAAAADDPTLGLEVGWHAVVRAITTRVEASATEDASFMALGFQAGLVYAMRREGKPVIAPGLSEVLGSEYGADGGESQQVLHVAVDDPPPDGQVIARLAVKEIPDPGDPFAPKVPPTRSVTVTYAGPRAHGARVP
ncbi:MAG: hypothetical protein ICV69_05545 [Thermoleophilaceae bacterium]|nr:hypothetical protein [Thermoleophilaceae bacterium]